MRRWSMLGVIAAVSLVAGGVASAAPAPAPAVNYVAFGDSAAAGPLIPPQNSIPCLRTDRNWPHIFAAARGITNITDVTCSSAEIPDLAGRQKGLLNAGIGPAIAPQYAALRPDTTLVTVQIGANDVDLTSLIIDCMTSKNCVSKHSTGAGEADLNQRFATMSARYNQMLDDIAKRAPKATVVTVGYGTYLIPDGCPSVQPFTPAAANFVRSLFTRVNSTIRDAAAKHRVQYIDIATPSAAHSMCAPEPDRWFEGVIPESVAVPIHPTAHGMAALGAIIAQQVA